VIASVEETARRDRLYWAHATPRSGPGSGPAARLSYRRDIRPALPPAAAGPVVDIGCGQGGLVALLVADGYAAEGIDLSPGQVAIARAAGLTQVHQGDYRALLAARPASVAAITATDLLEHLGKQEVLDTFDCVAAALLPGGVFIGRVPNAASPLGGGSQHGDFTHETAFTGRSIRQLAAATGFRSLAIRPCAPVADGLLGAGRVAVWKPVSALFRLALAAETGVLRGHILTQDLIFVARKAGAGSGPPHGPAVPGRVSGPASAAPPPLFS
jgi:2-polyprenyl-3-methyl-5-hydroxy-6-metoxy-1,4-benzoquinol methylase